MGEGHRRWFLVYEPKPFGPPHRYSTTFIFIWRCRKWPNFLYHKISLQKLIIFFQTVLWALLSSWTIEAVPFYYQGQNHVKEYSHWNPSIGENCKILRIFSLLVSIFDMCSKSTTYNRAKLPYGVTRSHLCYAIYISKAFYWKNY